MKVQAVCVAESARAGYIVGREEMHRYRQHDRQQSSNDAGSSPTDAIAHFALAHEMSEVRPASA
jgi:hypothetical protein